MIDPDKFDKDSANLANLIDRIKKEAEEILQSYGYSDVAAASKEIDEILPVKMDFRILALCHASFVISSLKKILRYAEKGDIENLFLETVRMTANAIRAKSFPSLLFGQAHRLQQKNRKKKQEEKQAPVTAALHENIKAAAAKLGGKSKWSKAEVLARKFDLSAERIRKII